MIPYGRHDVSQADIQSVVEVLRSDWLTEGPMVPRFERELAAYTGGAHAVATNSATGSLHVACLALGVGPADRVWTSPNTFVASANCAIYCGAKVDFVDIDSRTYNISVDRLSEKLEKARKTKTLPKVLIPVHFAGQPCDMPAIHALGQKYGFKIIEDASHAIGATYRQIRVGSCRHSDITIFSFHPVKIVTTGEGGVAVTNDPVLAERMIRLRSHGITSKLNLMQPRPVEQIWNYQQIDLGFNYRMTDLQAALGLSQLRRLEEFLERRRKIADRYNAELATLPIILPWQAPFNLSSYHLYPIQICKHLCGKSQRQVYEALTACGIGVNVHYIPVYRQPFFEDKGFKEGYCPEAEKYYKQVITIPIYPNLSDEQFNQVVHALVKVLEQ